MKLNRILKPLIATCAALALTVTLPSCGDTHEGLAEDMMDSFEEMVEALEDAKDKSSAEDAAEKIAEITEDMKDLAKRAKELPKLDEEEDKELQKKFEGRMKELTKRMMAAAMKVAKNPEVTKALEGAMKKMQDIDMELK